MGAELSEALDVTVAHSVSTSLCVLGLVQTPTPKETWEGGTEADKGKENPNSSAWVKHVWRSSLAIPFDMIMRC